MKAVALTALEKAINTYLQLDTETVARLAQLSDKVIGIEITDWYLTLYLLPHHQGLSVLTNYEGAVDTFMRSDLCGFINIAQSKGDTRALFQSKLHIEGDARTGELLRDILGKIDIDWEEHLSKITGDVVAYNIFSGLRQISQLVRRTQQRLGDNIAEYIREEKRWALGQQELEDFYEEIAELRSAVDRLEARIQLQLKKERN